MENASASASADALAHSAFTILHSAFCISSESRPLELLFQVAEREPQGRRPSVRAIARALDQLPAGEQGLDFGGGQGVAGLHRGLAGHHVEDLVEEFLLVQVEQLLLAA